MNERHLALCASSEWAEAVAQWILPWTLAGLSLGDRTVEFGPGPGVTTDLLAGLTRELIAVEVDPFLAARLVERFADREGVQIIAADAADSGLADGCADSVICLTMLHHVPTTEQQNAIFREAHRLLAAGGIYVGSDSLDGPDFRDLHEGDTCNPVPPATLAARLRQAGFGEVDVEVNEWAVRFRARRS